MSSCSSQSASVAQPNGNLSQLSLDESHATQMECGSVECTCTAGSHRASCFVNCAACKKPTQVACLANEFKLSGELPLKNTYAWLEGFLTFHRMQFYCSACRSHNESVGISHNGNPGQSRNDHIDASTRNMQDSSVVDSSNQPSNILHSMSTQVSDLSAKMVVITQQISSLQSSMSTVFTSISASNTSNTNDTDTSSGVRNSSIMSYSHAVTKDISDMVKSAVTTSLQEQKSAERKEERDKATVVLYNAKENGQDPADVRALLSKLQCDIGFSSCYRLGRSPPSGSPSSRPLKVILSSASDRDYLLETCDYARNVLRSSGIRIMPWLQPSEMVRVKEMRQRCVELNDKLQCLANGKKPYVVISGRIMIRGSDGKLHVVKDSVSSDSGKITQPMQHQPHLQFRTSTSFAPSQPKNT